MARGTGPRAGLDTNGIVRAVLLSAFVVALLLGTTGFYLVLHDRAIQRQAIEAGRLLTTATAIRNYTDTNVAPALKSTSPDTFHVETVPAFAAQTVYRTVQGVYPGYTYREPALKPTNPADLPTPFEVSLIDKFRDTPDLKELTGVRDDGNGRVSTTSPGRSWRTNPAWSATTRRNARRRAWSPNSAR